MKNRVVLDARVLFLLVLALVLATAGSAAAQGALPAFSKSFSPSTIGPGSVSTLEFEIVNAAPLPVENLAFTDTLPGGLAIASPARVSNGCAGVVSAPGGGNTISLSGGSVGGSSTCLVAVDVTASTPGTLSNASGDLTSDAGNSGPATADLTVAADRPGFTKSFAPSAVFFGGRSTLTLVIDNSANPSAVTFLSFTDSFPTGLVIAAPANASTDCGGTTVTLTATAGTGLVSLTANGSPVPGFEVLAANAICSVTVDVVADATGALDNTTGDLNSTVGGQNRFGGRASATLTATVEQISLTKEFIDDPTPPGGQVTLQFTVRNLDRGSSASNITFTDDLDATLSGLQAASLPASPCGAGSQLTGSGVLTLSGGTLGAEGSCTFSATLDVPAGATPGSYTNTTSSITADVGGSSATGDPASDVLFVQAVPRLTKSFLDVDTLTEDPVVGSGSDVVLRFSVLNTSATSTATEIAFIDDMTAFLPFPIDATLPSTPCGVGSTLSVISLGTERQGLSLLGGTLGPAVSCQFDVTLGIPVGLSGRTYDNVTSEITATVDGESVSGSPASDSLDIVGAPKLVKSFPDGPATPGQTTTLRFILSHLEAAQGEATDITFSDDLDAALSGLVATGLPASDVCGIGSQIDGTGTLLLTGGSLLPGEVCEFDVILQVPATAPTGDHTNTTSLVQTTVLGEAALGELAEADLTIAGLRLTKEFTDDPVLPGGQVTLEYTIDNLTDVADATAILLQDRFSQVLAGLAVSPASVPADDFCGIGSTMTLVSGNTQLTVQGASVPAGASCSFSVVLDVPSNAAPVVYASTTSFFIGNVEGASVLFANAHDRFEVVSSVITLTKEFTEDPVAPGDTTTLRFTVANPGPVAVTDLAFTDDLEAALSGLTSTSGTVVDVCGSGSQITGASLLAFSGGSLAAGASCSFDVDILVPPATPYGSVADNTTSPVAGTAAGLGVTGDPATDRLIVDYLVFTKAFDGSGGPAIAGGEVDLTFSIENLSDSESATRLGFSDDLAAVLPGLEAIGFDPALSVDCGVDALLSGTSFLTFIDGSLLPGASCSFTVTLSVPSIVDSGSFENVTSSLSQEGLPAASPATATLDVVVVADSDGDGVLDPVDVCADTVIPESVPTSELKPNRYALVDGDLEFDTVPPNGNGGGPGDVFTTTDTAGCSCEQIIDAVGLGSGHTKFGCSVGEMRDWVDLVSSGALLQIGPQARRLWGTEYRGSGRR